MAEPKRTAVGDKSPFTGERFDWYHPLPDEYFLESFNTELSPEDEATYQEWILEKGVEAGFELAPFDYDYRGAFEAGVDPNEVGHWPDTWKKPNHPTFSDESVYHGAPHPQQPLHPGLTFEGGSWDGEDFTPSDFQRGTTWSRPPPAKRPPPEPIFEHESESFTPQTRKEQRNRIMLGSIGMLEPLQAMKDPRITSRSPQSYDLEYVRAAIERDREAVRESPELGPLFDSRNPFNSDRAGSRIRWLQMEAKKRGKTVPQSAIDSINRRYGGR